MVDPAFVSINLGDECSICHLDTGEPLEESCDLCLNPLQQPITEGFNQICEPIHLGTRAHGVCLMKDHEIRQQNSRQCSPNIQRKIPSNNSSRCSSPLTWHNPCYSNPNSPKLLRSQSTPISSNYGNQSPGLIRKLGAKESPPSSLLTRSFKSYSCINSKIGMDSKSQNEMNPACQILTEGPRYSWNPLKHSDLLQSATDQDKNAQNKKSNTALDVLPAEGLKYLTLSPEGQRKHCNVESSSEGDFPLSGRDDNNESGSEGVPGSRNEARNWRNRKCGNENGSAELTSSNNGDQTKNEDRLLCNVSSEPIDSIAVCDSMNENTNICPDKPCGLPSTTGQDREGSLIQASDREQSLFINNELSKCRCGNANSLEKDASRSEAGISDLTESVDNCDALSANFRTSLGNINIRRPTRTRSIPMENHRTFARRSDSWLWYAGSQTQQNRDQYSSSKVSFGPRISLADITWCECSRDFIINRRRRRHTEASMVMSRPVSLGNVDLSSFGAWDADSGQCSHCQAPVDSSASSGCSRLIPSDSGVCMLCKQGESGSVTDVDSKNADNNLATCVCRLEPESPVACIHTLDGQTSCPCRPMLKTRTCPDTEACTTCPHCQACRTSSDGQREEVVSGTASDDEGDLESSVPSGGLMWTEAMKYTQDKLLHRCKEDLLTLMEQFYKHIQVVSEELVELLQERHDLQEQVEMRKIAIEQLVRLQNESPGIADIGSVQMSVILPEDSKQEKR